MRAEGAAMIWAREPPTSEVVADALVLIDVLAMERDRAVRGLPISGLELRSDEVHDIFLRVMPEAVAQYLRLNPMARVHNNARYVSVYAPHEVNYVCLFCRDDIGTMTRLYDKRESTLADPFVRNLYTHADLCAARYLAGQICGFAPRRAEHVPSVAKLVGHELINYVEDAATYLGRERPPMRYVRRGPHYVSGNPNKLRKIVTEARKVAKEAAVMAAMEGPVESGVTCKYRPVTFITRFGGQACGRPATHQVVASNERGTRLMEDELGVGATVCAPHGRAMIGLWYDVRFRVGMVRL